MRSAFDSRVDAVNEHALRADDERVARDGELLLRRAERQLDVDGVAGREQALDGGRLHEHFEGLRTRVARGHDRAHGRREGTPVGRDVHDVARADGAHVAQRHEEADLQLVGIDDPRDDLAACDFLADALDPLGHDAREGRAQVGARELLVGLGDERARDVEIRGREVAGRLRLVDLHARHRGARRAQALDLALEALQVHLRAGGARGLLGAGEPAGR